MGNRAILLLFTKLTIIVTKKKLSKGLYIAEIYPYFCLLIDRIGTASAVQRL